MKKKTAEKFIALLDIMKKLREKCPWDKMQTPESLRKYIIEETYEVVETIDQKKWSALCEELGDLLLQIVFQSVIAEEKSRFDISDVLTNINQKLIKRHPHVFDAKRVISAKEVENNWENIKANSEKRDSLLSGIPMFAPALLSAQRLQEKASRVGFDWPDIDGVIQKFHEEFYELKEAIDKKNKKKIFEEMGDLLFTLVNLARFLDITAEDALRLVNEKFRTRFRYIEKHYDYDFQKIKSASLEELDSLWEESKGE
jgi:tetrapyrrole methylase family protein/MazG family protein